VAPSVQGAPSTARDVISIVKAPAVGTEHPQMIQQSEHLIHIQYDGRRSVRCINKTFSDTSYSCETHNSSSTTTILPPPLTPSAKVIPHVTINHFPLPPSLLFPASPPFFTLLSTKQQLVGVTISLPSPPATISCSPSGVTR